MSLMILMVFIFTGCSSVSRYVEPFDENNNAELFVDISELLENESFPISITLELDGKVIDTFLYPTMEVYVAEGEHELVLDITAYYNGYRAKHNISKIYNINFKANETYKVSAKVLESKLRKLTDNALVSYSITSMEVNITDKLILEDSFFKSIPRGSQENRNKNIVDAVIQTVVLPAM